MHIRTPNKYRVGSWCWGLGRNYLKIKLIDLTVLGTKHKAFMTVTFKVKGFHVDFKLTFTHAFFLIIMFP